MSPIRVALIGYGYAGKTFHAPYIQATDGLELTHVGSSRPDDVHADLPDVTVVGDPAALAGSGDVDLVVVAAPNDQHAPLASAALRAGSHVVVDKPFALDVAEARELRAIAAEAGKVLSVFHNRRWDSDYLGIKSLIEAGTLGEVVHFESHIDRFRPHVRDRWRESNTPGGGIWYDLGPHLLDQALQLFGVPDDVEGNLATLRPGGKIDDWAHVVLNYPDRRVIVHASMLVAGGSPRFIVHGTNGSAVKPLADRQEAQLLDGLRPGAPEWGVDPDPLLVTHEGEDPATAPAPRGDQSLYYAGVRDAINGQGYSGAATSAESLAVMAVLEAARTSATERRAGAVDLTEVERAELA